MASQQVAASLCRESKACLFYLKHLGKCNSALKLPYSTCVEPFWEKFIQSQRGKLLFWGRRRSSSGGLCSVLETHRICDAQDIPASWCGWCPSCRSISADACTALCQMSTGGMKLLKIFTIIKLSGAKYVSIHQKNVDNMTLYHDQVPNTLQSGYGYRVKRTQQKLLSVSVRYLKWNRTENKEI